MRHRTVKDAPHIRRRDIIRAPGKRRGLCHSGHSQCGARARPLYQFRQGPCSRHEPYNIVQYFVAHIDLVCLCAQRRQSGLVQSLLHAIQGIALLFPAQHAQLILRFRVSEGQLHHKPVQLGIRQKLRPRRSGGILCCNNDKRAGQRMRYAVHGHLPLLHGLQQCGLCAAGRTVQLIGQEQVAQHGAGLVFHFPHSFVVKRETRHI